MQEGHFRSLSCRLVFPHGGGVAIVGVLFICNGTAAFADTIGSTGTLGSAAGSGGSFGSVLSSPLLAQGAAPIAPVRVPIITPVPPSSTILPTDVLPLPQIQNRLTFAENLQLRILQRLPARFYFTSSTEVSLRYESNPFQFPTKRRFIRQLGPAFTNFRDLNVDSQQQVLHQLQLPGAKQAVFRVLPNVTGGFTLTPHSRFFCNYFMIRDSLSRSTRLNTTINSIAYGFQQDIPLGNRGNLQAEIQARSLYQAHQRPVFDFLPGLTLSYVLTPRTVGFVNALLQIRGNEYYQAPTRELDPFYTWGVLHQRGGWSFSASTTFVQNFREQFRNAQIKQDNYAFISDFEIARRLFRQLPGVQAFVRAEPIWNFHSRYRPGLAGMDFRLFSGIRIAVTKPSLTAGLEQLKQQIEEQEGEPPSKPGAAPRPSAYLMPYQVIASARQPIHGFINTSAAVEQPIHAMLDRLPDHSADVAAAALAESRPTARATEQLKELPRAKAIASQIDESLLDEAAQQVQLRPKHVVENPQPLARPAQPQAQEPASAHAQLQALEPAQKRAQGPADTKITVKQQKRQHPKMDCFVLPPIPSPPIGTVTVSHEDVQPTTEVTN